MESIARTVWHKAGRWLVAAAGAVALTMGAALAEAGNPQPLRVLTWNIWDLPGVAENSEPLSDEQRWAHISRRILGGNYDIVVLNEVFGLYSGAAFRAYLTQTSPSSEYQDLYSPLVPDATTPGTPVYGTLPYSVWADGQGDLGTAGIMILTKFPPLPRFDLPLTTPDYGSDDWQYGKVEHTCVQKTLVADGNSAGPAANFGITNFPDVAWTNGACAAAFHEFEVCEASDCGASKGIAWLRVMNTTNNQPLNIFFTHTQADYPEESPPEDYSATRAIQWEEIRLFIEKMAPPNEPILLMGDLNVLGDGAQFLSGYSLVQNASEYADHLAFPGTIGLLTPHDMYHYQFQHLNANHPARTDPGFTRHPVFNSNDALDPYPQRLDYILAYFGPDDNGQNCPAHVRVRRDFDVFHQTSGGNDYKGSDLSDHWPVEATIGWDGPYCAPRKSLDNPSPGTYDMNIHNDGGYQWLWFPAFTDILLGVDSVMSSSGQFLSSAYAEVFPAHNISQPAELFGGQPEQGQTPGELFRRDKEYGGWAVLSFPYDYYVRIRATKPDVVGTFKIKVVKPDGKTFNKAIPLSPRVGFIDAFNDPYVKKVSMHGTMPPVVPVGQNKVYFRFNAAQMVVKNQTFEFSIVRTNSSHDQAAASPGKYAIEVLDAAKNVLVPKTAWYQSVSMGFEVDSIGPQKMEDLRLVVHRPCTVWTGACVTQPDYMRVGMRTNGRIVSFLGYRTIEQSDSGIDEDDEPFGKLHADGESWILWTVEADEPGGRPISSMHWYGATGPDVTRIGFTQHVEMRWGENDGPDGDFSNNNTSYWYYNDNDAGWIFDSDCNVPYYSPGDPQHPNVYTHDYQHFNKDGHYKVSFTCSLPK